MDDTLATPTDERAPRRVRHALRFRALDVRAVERITPHLVRVTLEGADLAGFHSPGFDDHAKLFFPDEATGVLTLPTLGADGPVWPEGRKPTMRDYTPRHFDAGAGTLEIDFALHVAGPATRWAERAAPGQRLGVGGPRGSFLVPTAFDGHVLIGDDTALHARHQLVGGRAMGGQVLAAGLGGAIALAAAAIGGVDVQVAQLLEQGERGIDDAGTRRIAAAEPVLDRLDEFVAVRGLVGDELQQHEAQAAVAEDAAAAAAAAAATTATAAACWPVLGAGAAGRALAVGAVVVAMAMVAGKGMMDVSHGTLLDGRCATIKDISDLYLDRIVKLR